MTVRSRLMAAAATLTLLACGGAPDATEIHIGVAGPLAQASGRSMQRAAAMAADEINRGGALNGRTLLLIARDDGASAQGAIEVARELRDDPRVVAVVGHINSAATLAASRIYNDPRRGVVQISPASSSPEITGAGAWTFRVCPTDLQHGPALARWAYDELGSRRALVLYANDAYGRGVLDTFAEAFREAGGVIISTDPFLPEMMQDGTELDAYLRRGVAASMDALMIAGQAEEGARVVSAARRLGYSGPVLGPDGMTGLREQGELADGVFVSSAFLPDTPAENARAFVLAYQERFGELPDHRAAMTYDAVMLLAQGLAEVGPQRGALRDYLAAVGSSRPPFEGVAGTIAFDENGDVAGKDVAVGVIRDGRLQSAARTGT
ncbi:MAG: ABC transporter substrate-binding protein [Longimicrobiales bacterium]